MATNAKTDTKVADDDKQVTDDDLRKSKEDSEVELAKADEAPDTDESNEESEETDDDQKSDSQDEETEDDSSDDSDDDSSEFVKGFSNIKGDTLEDYARGLEEAYKNSTAEALRLKGLVDGSQDETTQVGDDSEDDAPVDPRMLYLDQMLQKEITDSYDKFSKRFPQTQDPTEYAKFQTEVSNLSRYIITSQKRVAPASELYSKVAVILDWKPDEVRADSNDKLKVALKNSASSSKTTSATKPKSGPSKITDAEISIAKAMGGWTDGKSDAEIRKELESVS